jgi:hypothetical protein
MFGWGKWPSNVPLFVTFTSTGTGGCHFHLKRLSELGRIRYRFFPNIPYLLIDQKKCLKFELFAGLYIEPFELNLLACF